jgi:hypothetical protein
MSPAEMRISLRMPESLKEPLHRAARANGHSLSDEVRQRLVASFDPPSAPTAPDPKTQELLSAVARMADAISKYYPPWYADPFSFRGFVTAINKLLMRRYRPPGDLENPEPKPLSGLATEDLFDEKPTTDSVSAMLVAVANFAVDEEKR